jgi:hypothetical protein
VSELPPTQELILEVLAARWRLGESTWTFDKRLTPTVKQLAAAGLVGWKAGIIEKTILVWFTRAGATLTLSSTYTPPNRILSIGDLAH